MGANGRLATIEKFTPGTSFVEAYGLLTASLVLGNGNGINGAEGGTRVICVTAGRSGDGTSTTSVNLAFTIAGTGRRTLLVDSNFRTPILHQPFGAAQSPGLAEVLMKKAALSETIRSTTTPQLYLLPAGTMSESPQVALQASVIHPLLTELKASFEFIVIDTAPALRFPDALHIARAADGTIVVLPAGRAQRLAAIEMRRRLERVGVKISGIVLNRTDPKEAAAF